MQIDQPRRNFFTKKDLIIIAAVLLVAAAGFLVKYLLTDPNSAVEAKIYYNAL